MLHLPVFDKRIRGTVRIGPASCRVTASRRDSRLDRASGRNRFSRKHVAIEDATVLPVDMQIEDIEKAIRFLNAEKAELPSSIHSIILRSLYEAAKRRTPQLAADLPETAPKLYADRPRGQTIIDFLGDPEGWGPYVRAGRLSRPDFRRLDPQGEMALRNWLRIHKKLPSDMHIPTKIETVDARLEASLGDEASFLEARRLVAAQHRRRRQKLTGGPQ